MGRDKKNKNKNIVRGVVEGTAWEIDGMWWFIDRDKVVYETTTACYLGGQNKAFSDNTLELAKPPTPQVLPSTPSSVFCISHSKET
jgi:hypothetical protein